MSQGQVCCICGEPVAPPGQIIGQRLYCPRHYAAVNRPHPGLVRATIVQVAGVVVLSAVVVVLTNLVAPPEGWALLAVGLGLAIVPSALWLIFFYQQDRLEPEPKTNIVLVFLLALLLTDVVGLRLIVDWFQLGRFATSTSLPAAVGSSLIAGFTLQAIAYVAVRVTVYATPEFDERMDGIVYGTVAGLGIATLLNLRYVLDNGGVALAMGVISVVTTALAQASVGGVMGYFMAGAKFAHKPIWWVPFGVSLAALSNGLFTWLVREVSAVGLGVAPWRSLALAIGLALVVFLALVVMMRRAVAATLATPAR